MTDSLILQFLYHTPVGRVILKGLVHPKLSFLAGCFLSSGLSKPIVPYYIRKHHIRLDGIVVPEKGFASFNDFFTRKRKKGVTKPTPGQLISPSDGYFSGYDLQENTVLEIKNSRYHLKDLFRDKGLARQFEGGKALVIRLTPANYHRYCYPVSGKILMSRKVRGKLHCVRPIALAAVPVFVQNSREYQVIRSDAFGLVAQMEVGALLVGRIKNRQKALKNGFVQAGEEKGYFEFGGSTIILFFQKDAISLEEKLVGSTCDAEIPVRMGEGIANRNTNRQ